MENQNEPLLIRPSGTPKTNTKGNFCPQSFPTIAIYILAPVHVCISVIFHVIQIFAQFTQNLFNTAKIDMFGT